MEPPSLSILIPARDEEANILPLFEELETVLAGMRLRWEVIVIDDASQDHTLDRLRDIAKRLPGLKILSFRSHRGKSAALAAGIAAAQGTLIGMMDADLQNRPTDFLPMLRRMEEDSALTLIQGNRVNRQDSRAKCLASQVGFLTRRIVLGDRIRDTGCGLMLVRREAAVALPLHFEGMHRFLPFLVTLQGGRVQDLPVAHRARHSGTSKYRIGFLSRGCGGFLDLLAVRWMKWRRRDIRADDPPREVV